MNGKQKRPFYLQQGLGRAAFFFTAPLIVLAIRLCGYRVRDLKGVRENIRGLMEQHKGPWLICANHLTLIDSAILGYAMFPAWRYLWDYKRLPWNVPEKMNFNRNLFLTVCCYLLKCVPISRGGDRNAVKSTLEKIAYLLQRGETFLLFPEGTRSRGGRIDLENFQYGVGRLFSKAPDCRVMCVYLRGDGQDTYSNFPKYKETFTVKSEICHPVTGLKGLRAQRECAKQIINHLYSMEKLYFDETRGQ